MLKRGALKHKALNLERGALNLERGALNARARKIPLNYAGGAEKPLTVRAALRPWRQIGLFSSGPAEGVVLQRP